MKLFKQMMSMFCCISLLIGAFNVTVSTVSAAESYTTKAVSFKDWKQKYGGWQLNNGVFSLVNNYRRYAGGNFYLDFKGSEIFTNNFSADFTINLPTKSSVQSNRVNLQLFIYNAQTNQYTNSRIEWGPIDVFASADGLGLSWIAGDFSAFSSKPQYDCSAKVVGNQVTWQIGPYSAVIDLTNAVWQSGKPETSLRMGGVAKQNYALSNLTIYDNTNQNKYDYTGYTNTDENVVLIGLSHMQMWEDYYELLGDDYIVSNCAVGGTCITHWNEMQPWDFPITVEGVVSMNPDKLVLSIGSNDLKVGTSVNNTYTMIKSYLSLLQQQLPNTEIYYVSNFATLLAEDGNMVEKLYSLNDLMRDWCPNNSVKYIDIASGYVNADGSVKSELFTFKDGQGGQDRAHPNYSYWNTVVPQAIKNTVGTTYYISNSFGNDANNGLSSKTPWKSFANVSELRLKAGDKVLLRRGDTWNERLTISGPNGTAEDWVYIGPYGNLANPAPIIDLYDNDNMDDICILVQDCVPESNARTCNYVQVDNITMKNAVLGVYFRYTCTNLNSDNSAIPNKGVSVTNCSFYNMRSTAWDNELAAGTTDNIGILTRPKGNLPFINDHWQYESTGGGAYEYFYAAAIMIGGKPKRIPQGNAVVTDINIKNIYGENCNFIIQSHGYFLEPEFDWEHTKNWRIEDVYGVESGLFTLDNITGGWDGTDQSQWGIIRNVGNDKGPKNPVAINGTAIAGVVTAKDLLIENCVFDGCENADGRYPDGCGFDFERNCINVNVRNSIISNNAGQGILMMRSQDGIIEVDGETRLTYNINCSVTGSLFYNNMRSVYADNYCYDMLIMNEDNQNITFSDNVVVYREKTAGKANVWINAQNPKATTYQLKQLSTFSGVTATDNNFIQNNALTVDNTAGVKSNAATYGLDACYTPVTMDQKSADTNDYFNGTNISKTFPGEWIEKNGSWTYTQGEVILTGKDNPYLGGLYLNCGLTLTDYQLNFVGMLPTTTGLQENRNAVLNYIYDAANNRYTFSTLEYGPIDCFVMGNGMGQQWVAGSWCNFGGTPEYAITISVKGNTIVYNVGDYTATVDLTNAVWLSGKPETNISFVGRLAEDYVIKDMYIIEGGHTLHNYSELDIALDLPEGFTANTGVWKLVDGGIELKSTAYSLFSLNYTKEKMQKVTVNLTISLPKTTVQGDRTELSFNVIDYLNNRYIPVEIMVGYMDSFIRCNGQTGIDTWIAGAWCNFGVNMTECDVTVTINGTVITGTVAGFPFSFDVAAKSDAQWISGLPATDFTVRAIGQNGCRITNFSTVSNRIAFDVTDDDVINIQDLVRLKKMISGRIIAPYYADFDTSGTVDAVDMVNLRKQLIGK